MSDVAAIIASWNKIALLRDCFDALQHQSYQKFEIFFVDNGSTDGSLDFVQQHYPEVHCISLGRNYGFAEAYNQGIRLALANPLIQYVVTLNNDTKADVRYIEELVTCAKRHPTAGSIQPKVINFFNPSLIDSVGMLMYADMSAINRGQKEEDKGQYEQEAEVFGASASAALYTRIALEKTALPSATTHAGEDYFDSDYFAYYEDVDLAWRLRLFGFSCFYAPKAKVFHMHSATGQNFSPFKAFHIHRNQYYNIIKNLPFYWMIRALLLLPVRYCLLLTSVMRGKGAAAQLKGNLGREKGSMIMIVFRSWKEVLVNLPRMFRKRRYIMARRTANSGDIQRWLLDYRADWKKIIYGS